MQCPSCAAPIEAEQQFGHFHICPFCHAGCVIDGKAARLSGQMAVLSAPEGPLAVDAEGTLEGIGFRVIGRMRQGYAAGFWDEWWLAYDDGAQGWVSEDESDYWSETVHGKAAVDDLDQLVSGSPGDRRRIAGTTYTLTEQGVGTVEGGEGQLPEPLEVGGRFRYFDLRGDEGETATVEIDLEGEELDLDSVRVFTGRPIAIESIAISVPGRRGDSLDKERAAGAGGRERVVKQAGRSLRLGCDACGGELPTPDGNSTELECPHCGTIADLSVERQPCGNCGIGLPIYGGNQAGFVTCRTCGAQQQHLGGELTVLQILADDRRPKPPVPLGSVGTLAGVEWRAVGYLRMVERDGKISYFCDEQLLWSPRRGYAWLVREGGHFSLCQELSTPPKSRLRRIAQRKQLKYGDRDWRVFEKGQMAVDFVDGELSWVAQIGDKVLYADAISPPYMLSEEVSLDADGKPAEIEWSRSLYLKREQVARAFDVSRRDLGREPHGVAPHQPFEQAPFWRDSAKLMLGVAALNLILLLWAATKSGDRIAGFDVRGADYYEGWLSPEFEIPDVGGVLAVSGYANVSNSWVYVQVAVVEAETASAVQDLDLEMSYYSGYEGGEAWSEGSQDDTAALRLEKPGRYQLLVQGRSGQGETTEHTGDATLDMKLSVHDGYVLKRFFLILFLVSLIWCLAVWIPRLTFEGKRWAPVTGDD